MPRDYKDRAGTAKKKNQQQASVVWWKWLLIVLLIALFVAFLFFLRGSGSEIEKQTKQVSPLSDVKKLKKAATPKHQNKEPVEPRFDFYTILPETEIEVPDYEINTRSREERIGKAKASKYILQAGSFREFTEADKLRARLALIGIESRVEKAKIGRVVWNRVKIGPYSRSSSISLIKKRLKNNGIDAIVTEVKS